MHHSRNWRMCKNLFLQNLSCLLPLQRERKDSFGDIPGGVLTNTFGHTHTHVHTHARGHTHGYRYKHISTTPPTHTQTHTHISTQSQTLLKILTAGRTSHGHCVAITSNMNLTMSLTATKQPPATIFSDITHPHLFEDQLGGYPGPLKLMRSFM